MHTSNKQNARADKDSSRARNVQLLAKVKALLSNLKKQMKLKESDYLSFPGNKIKQIPKKQVI